MISRMAARGIAAVAAPILIYSFALSAGADTVWLAYPDKELRLSDDAICEEPERETVRCWWEADRNQSTCP